MSTLTILSYRVYTEIFTGAALAVLIIYILIFIYLVSIRNCGIFLQAMFNIELKVIDSEEPERYTVNIYDEEVNTEDSTVLMNIIIPGIHVQIIQKIVLLSHKLSKRVFTSGVNLFVIQVKQFRHKIQHYVVLLCATVTCYLSRPYPIILINYASLSEFSLCPM